MKRTTNAAERRHLASVAALGCIVCLECLGQINPHVQVHHARVKHGWGRSSHFATIPICNYHHNDLKEGIHGMGRAEFTALYGKSEIELLAIVNEKLGIA